VHCHCLQTILTIPCLHIVVRAHASLASVLSEMEGEVEALREPVVDREDVVLRGFEDEEPVAARAAPQAASWRDSPAGTGIQFVAASARLGAPLHPDPLPRTSSSRRAADQGSEAPHVEGRLAVPFALPSSSHCSLLIVAFRGRGTLRYAP
jgi:hypothetical protein